MIKAIDFYYFSGTGNTVIVLKEMKQVFDKNGIITNFKPIENAKILNIEEGTTLGLAFPINSQSTLPFIWKFIKSLPEVKGIPVFVLCTLNESSGILKPLFELLKKKGYIPMGSCEISMPNNTSTTHFDEKEYEKRMGEGIEKAERYALSLANGSSKWESTSNGSSFVSFLTRNTSLPWITMRFVFSYGVDKGKCTKCQTCVKLCPVQNIKMDEYPKHLKHCELCMRCISCCPQKAVSVKGKEGFKARKNTDGNPNIL